MADGDQPLLAPEYFEPLTALVAKYGIRNLVETGTGPMSSGLEAARRLGLQGYSCDVYEPCVARARSLYPGFHVFFSESLAMFREVLPQLEGPTFFWLDGHCPTDQQAAPGAFEHIFPLYDELALIRDLKRGFERDVIWADDIPMVDVPDNPIASRWDVTLGAGFGSGGVRWQGERSHPWSDYLALFAASHDSEIVAPMWRLTPK